MPAIPFPVSGPCTPGIVPDLTPLDSYSSLYITWSMPDISALTTHNFIETYEVQLTLQNPEVVKIMQVKKPGLELRERKSGEMVFVSVRAKCSCGNFGLQQTLCHLISKCDTYMCVHVMHKDKTICGLPCANVTSKVCTSSQCASPSTHTRCGVCEVFNH